MFALAAYWGAERKPFTDAQREGLMQVYQEYPLGQANFNIWLEMLRQAAAAKHLQGQ
tara:strand:- start:806 stop:976 length:171 start_codon:yes stop_codon:yes gene_type:complete